MESEGLKKVGLGYLRNCFLEDEMTWTEFKDEFSKVKRPLCPECVNHTQIRATAYKDCKNTYGIIKNGKFHTVGQCCCYSEDHD